MGSGGVSNLCRACHIGPILTKLIPILETNTDPRLRIDLFSTPPPPDYIENLPLRSKHLTRKVVVLKVQLPQLSEPAQLRRYMTFSGTLNSEG